MKLTTFIPTLLLTACATAAVAASPATDKSGVLADHNGRTLYIFKKDTADNSSCNDQCAKVWPPFVVADPSKANDHFKVITRMDGSKQWSFKGQPLYYYAADAAPGDLGGEGIGGVWYAIRSAASARPARSGSSSYGY